MKKQITDIRFWIIFFFLIRMYGITNPPLEVSHNWRQSTVTMVSRNFLEVDNNIFYPRVDIAGEKTGITGMEFPILNYLIYMVSYLFGYQHWYGRLINLLFSSFGIWFFYKLIRKYFQKDVAFYSAIILTVSIWFQFSRKIMPDTFSVSLIIAGIYYGLNYLESKKDRGGLFDLIAYVFLLTIGILSKLPSGFLLIVFVFVIFSKNVLIRKKIIFSIVSILGFIPGIIWYFFWVPHLVEAYGFLHFYMGTSFKNGIIEIIENTPKTLNMFYETALQYIGFAAFLFGLIYSIIKNDKKIYLIFLITFLSFCIIIFKSGQNFPRHSYYIVPFVPIMALIAGYGLSKIRNVKISLFILIVIATECIANQQHDFRIKESEQHILHLENDLSKVSEKDDLILINSGLFPTPMYFAHRKGWVDSNEKIADDAYIRKLTAVGLKYIVILKKSFGGKMELDQYDNVLENKDYIIYRIGSVDEK